MRKNGIALKNYIMIHYFIHILDNYLLFGRKRLFLVKMIIIVWDIIIWKMKIGRKQKKY